jgi:hypothetical protein
VYLRNNLEGPMEGQEDRTPRVQLCDDNAALLDACRAITAPKLHVILLAHLGHGPSLKHPAFFVQVSSSDFLTLGVPPTMERPVIKKYKLKKDRPL